MTTLVTHNMCKYLTTPGGWREEDYRARILVKSLKGEDFEGYWHRKIGDKTVRLDQSNMDVTVDFAAQVLANRIKDLITKSVTLVPIPNSNACVGGPRDFRTRLFANAIAEYAGDRVAVKSAFLWKAAKDKQHKAGGYRHASQFIRLLELVYTPKRPVVLIDDMITSGSQMLACTYLLRKAGVEVLFGMAVGRQTTSQEQGVLMWDEKEISQLIV